MIVTLPVRTAPQLEPECVILAVAVGAERGAVVEAQRHILPDLRIEPQAEREMIARKSFDIEVIGCRADIGIAQALTAPNQHTLKLTATEFAFMAAWCNRLGQVCQREELVEILSRPRSSFDNRHLDAVVSRLRRKIEDHASLPAPIKVVYGVGYTFTANVAVD